MDCFISYATADIDVARGIRQCLSSYGVNAFLAQDSVHLGADWRAAISTAVQRAEVVLLLDSPQSRHSPWVQQEAGMAQASGSLVIPISLDGRLDELPGWLGGIQAISVGAKTSVAELAAAIARVVFQRLGASWAGLLPDPREPKTVAASVMRTVLFDQFDGPAERMGAWSRQYDRYLRMYYGEGAVPTTVSQGASLTFTGMIVERLAAFAASSGGTALGRAAISSLGRAEVFVQASQDPPTAGIRPSLVGRKGPFR